MSIQRTIRILSDLQCPDVRRAEGGEEWRVNHQTYRWTPDLVAGPLIGEGNPRDFYIDVVWPTGDPYVKPKAGDPGMQAAVAALLEGKPGASLEDLGENFDHLHRPLAGKFIKYSNSRKSPLLGLVTYFNPTIEGMARQTVVAYLDAIRALDGALGITHFGGPETISRVHRHAQEINGGIEVVGLPIDIPIAFVLWFVDWEPRDNSAAWQRQLTAMMLINLRVAHPQYEHSDHGVVRWLFSLLQTPKPVLDLYLRGYFSNASQGR